MKMITQEELKNNLTYDELSGNFYWIKKGFGRSIKNPAGSICNRTGYIRIILDKFKYKAHRLVWLYVYGEFPKEDIDHINHNRADNSLKNLRVVTASENQKNRSKSKNNTTGFTGVYFDKKLKKYKVQIAIDKKDLHIGVFNDLFDAAFARRIAEIKYGFHDNHGI